jgi:hypothetical protein
MPEPTSPIPQTPTPSAPKQPLPSERLRQPSPVRPQGRSSLSMVIVVALIVILGFMWFSQGRLSGYSQDWQAVFLTNGQVYFGQVQKQNNAELVLKEIYYLQVTRPLQQTAEGEQQANPQGELSLVKLGNELHGPTDSMVVNRDHVLFVEDLKDDSNVVQAIDNYKSGQ